MRKRDHAKLPPLNTYRWDHRIRSGRRYFPAGSSLTPEQIDALRAYWAEWIADAKQGETDGASSDGSDN
jgi:hypothetical protein